MKNPVPAILGTFRSGEPAIRLRTARRAAFAATALLVVLFAWRSDDAFHAYAMAGHLVRGDGFVYNAGERVLATTCPFFTLLVAGAHFFTREMFVTSTLVDVALSLAAVWVLFFVFCRKPWQVFAAFLLCADRSFLTYSASGLENCALYLLAACMAAAATDGRRDFRALLRLGFLAALAAGTRMDNVLLYLPFLAWAFLFRENGVGRAKGLLAGFIGFLPFVLWEAFCTFYYGFPFPNTAYAKLGTGIPAGAYFLRGCSYLLATALVDPAVVLVPLAAAFPLLSPRRDRGVRLLSAGVLLYLAYVARIGGDFMLGRHFTVPFFLSVCLLFASGTGRTSAAAAADGSRRLRTFAWAAPAFFLAWTACVCAIGGRRFLLGEGFPVPGGIVDERVYYYRYTGFLPNLLHRKWRFERTWSPAEVKRIRAAGRGRAFAKEANGIIVYCNPDLYLTDRYALGEAFLAHVPSAPVEGTGFRIGHVPRPIPAGYVESVESGENRIVDPGLHAFYDKILLATRAPLFDRRRLRAILELNVPPRLARRLGLDAAERTDVGP